MEAENVHGKHLSIPGFHKNFMVAVGEVALLLLLDKLDLDYTIYTDEFGPACSAQEASLRALLF